VDLDLPITRKRSEVSNTKGIQVEIKGRRRGETFKEVGRRDGVGKEGVKLP